MMDELAGRRHSSRDRGTSGRRLPAADPDRGWIASARCRGLQPDLFFPPSEDGEEVEEAKAICGACPVRVECLAYALEANETFGVWGGTTPGERRRLRRISRRTRKTA